MIRKDRVTCSFSFRILYSLQVGGRKKGADLRQAILSRRSISTTTCTILRLQRQAHRGRLMKTSTAGLLTAFKLSSDPSHTTAIGDVKWAMSVTQLFIRKSVIVIYHQSQLTVPGGLILGEQLCL